MIKLNRLILQEAIVKKNTIQNAHTPTKQNNSIIVRNLRQRKRFSYSNVINYKI